MEDKTIFANIPLKLIKRTKTGKIQLSVVSKIGDKTVWQKIVLNNAQFNELITRLENV